jgi:hypothetical protein
MAFYASDYKFGGGGNTQLVHSSKYLTKGSLFDAQTARARKLEVGIGNPGETKDAFVAPCHDTDCYWRLAMEGPRALPEVGSYVVDIIIDTTQPRVFLSMLGLPGSDIPRNVRMQTNNVTIKDVRSNVTYAQFQPFQQAQALGKSKWALRFSRDGVVWLERSCEIFDHFLSGGVNAESATYVPSHTHIAHTVLK